MKALVIQTRERIVGLHRRFNDRMEQIFTNPNPPPVVPKDAIPFQEGVDEVLEERLPLVMRPTAYFVVFMFLTMILISMIMKVDVVVVGTGRFITDTPTIVLQPLETAIIRSLKVKAGEFVSKGQILATLDPTFAQADLASVSAQRQSLLSQERRLDAELHDRPFEAGNPPSTDDLLQATLYHQRQAEYASRLQMFDEEVLRLQSNIHTIKNDLILLSKQLEVARDVERMRADLAKSQSGSRLQLLDSQSARMRTERDFQEANNHLLELQHGVLSKQAERSSFIDEWHRQLLEQLVSLRTESVRTGEGFAKATLVRDLVVLTAPEDGVVLDVAKLSVGSVVRGAETLMTIVPAGATLVAEISILSSEVGYTKIGDDVVIKVDAFPYSRHGMLKGRLRALSEDAVSGAPSPAGSEAGASSSRGGASVYRGWVDLLTTKLDRMPKSSRFIPGMSLSAEIKVGSRSIMSYFISPVAGTLGTSFQEP